MSGLIKCDESSGDYLVSEMTAQFLGCPEVNLVAAKYFGKLPLYSGDSQEAWNVFRLELNKDVDITGWAKVCSQHGAKKSETADVIPPAEIRNCLFRNWYSGGQIGCVGQLEILFR